MSKDSLPREVLKWLQSLDLSYSVKNVKRDFSNGFLVAEIFSRYYQNDIQMHSFDNGSSVKRKLDNWQQLNKFFMKRDIPLIDKQLIEDVVHCKDKAGVKFVCEMYKYLTARGIPDMEALRVSGEDEVPYFARPTASRLIKETIKDSELTTTMKSQHSVSNKASQLLEQHSATIRADRTNDPSRYSTQQRNQTRAPPKAPQDQEKSSPLIEFKEVSVKPVERSVAQIRQSKDLSSRMMTEGSSVGGGGAEAAYNPGPTGRSSTDILETVISDVFRGSELLASWTASGESVLGAFTTAVNNHDVSIEDLLSFCDALVTNKDEASALGAAVLSGPKDFWTFFSLVGAFLSSTDAPVVIGAIEQLLVTIGAEATSRDAAVTRSYFVEYALPLLLPMLSTAIKRRPVLMGMYAFSENDVLTHARLIKTLQDSLGSGDIGAFIHCAAVMVSIESQFNDDLLDVYLYYAIMGASMAEPSVRAAALSMLPVIVEQNPALVVNMLGRLEPMVEDGWWEVQAQLLQACAALLVQLPAEDPASPRLYAIADAIMTRYTSPNIQKIGLSSLAKSLTGHPVLCKAYVQRLLALPHHFRMNLLGPSSDVEPVQILGATASNYTIDSLPATWPGYMVAKTVVDLVFEAGLANLEREHVAVLHAVLANMQGPSEEEVPAWSALFTTMKDYFYVSLCDEELAEGAVGIFEALLSILPTGVVISTFPTLLSSLLMMFPSGPQLCRDVTVQFLQGLKQRGGDYAAEVSNLLGTLPPELKGLPELAALRD